MGTDPAPGIPVLALRLQGLSKLNWVELADEY
jgi:hypothetical protein